MKYVGFTMREISAPNYAEERDGISRDWCQWASQREIAPILIPNCLSEPEEYLDRSGVIALILTGGNDLVKSPLRPNDVSATRNEIETALLRTAIKKKLPVLGTCRGLHLINQFFGGDLTEDINPDKSSKNMHVGRTHEVCLRGIFQELAQAETVETNSFHNQGIFVNQLSKELKPMAISVADNIIEGAFHPNLPVMGIQWHPERPNPATKFDDQIIGRLFESGCFWKNGN